MNKIFRIIWSKAKEKWVVVAEKVAAKNGCPSATVGALTVAALLAAGGTAFALDPGALPTGGQITAGSGSIATSGSQMTVNQSSQQMIANWNSFNIGQNAGVQFIQPNSAATALNRINDQNPSQILGSLTANGKVFLLNPAGIIFGQSARVDVGGLVASSLNMLDSDFLAGTFNFSNAGSAGSILNQGSITAANGGVVALIAPKVTNEGTISTASGSTLLAAANQVSLDFTGDGLISYTIDQGAVDALAENKGLIKANGGLVVMTAKAADSVTSAVVNNNGVIEATGINTKGGRIVLDGEATVNTGTLNVSGSSGGSTTLAGSYVLNSGTINAEGSIGTGGDILLTADRIIQTSVADLNAAGLAQGGRISLLGGSGEYDGIFSSASLTASGDRGGNITLTGDRINLRGSVLDTSGVEKGGSIRVGGDLHGNTLIDPITGRTLTNASVTDIASSNTLNASSLRGDGGRIVIWSDRQTYYYGDASAKTLGAGAGGFIEVSGKDRLQYGGTVDASSAGGKAGTVLFDPKDIVIDDSAGGGLSYNAFTNPNPGADTQFGTFLVALANGNMVATDPYAAAGGQSHAGAAYLFAPDGTLISTLTGSHTNDQIGYDLDNWTGGTTVLANDNYVISSPAWNSGTGAATWGSQTTGVSGIVASGNSLVGSQAGDKVGSGGYGAYILSNGNYVISSPSWSDGATTAVGAVTWGDGASGVTGVISSANSLIGSSANDVVGGQGITVLTGNSNYVVLSPFWNNVDLGVADAGAATWVNGATGQTSNATNTISSTNSIVGDFYQDEIGIGTATALTNGNYVVSNFYWHDGSGVQVGAATWVNGATGQTSNASNTVSVANSLVGTTVYDNISGNGISALSNGNYVLVSSNWNNGSANVGAVTWGNGATGTAGTVGAANSLLGNVANDSLGNGGITALTNGNYVVLSPYWDRGAIVNAGAATWQDGSTAGTRTLGATISTTNSLVGSVAEDKVGTTAIALYSNGNYVVGTPQYSSGTGAATWVDGSNGQTANATNTVSAANSILGSSAGAWNSTYNYYYGGDNVGANLTALTNGNYVVTSPSWASAKGAVTWGNGTTGTVGTISAANSLVGSTVGTFTPGDTSFTGGDKVGSSITTLTNGHYVVGSYDWSDGGLSRVGAVTMADGATGLTGIVSSTNSLVGSIANDRVGYGGIVVLDNGNFVVGSPNWDNGATVDAGAATWVDGTTGLTGAVDVANSLIGTAGQKLGGYLLAGNGNTFGVGDGINYWGVGIYTVSTASSYTGGYAFADNPAVSATLTSSQITDVLNTGSNLVLQANNDITVTSAVTVNNAGGNGGALTLQAGRSILVNNNITTDNGALTLVGNETTAAGVIDAQRDVGAAVVTMADGTSINAGSGAVSITLKNGAGKTNTTSGNITLEAITAGSLTVTNNGPTAGSDIVADGALVVAGNTTFTAATEDDATRYDITANNAANNFGAVSISSGNNVSLTDVNALVLGALTVTGTVDIATLTGDLTLSGAIATDNATANAIKLNAGSDAAAGTSTGGNLIISGGSVSTGTGGFAILYTGSVSGSTGLTALIGSGSGRFRYNSDETATNYSTVLTSGLNAIYREQPTLSVAPGNQSITYGDATPGFIALYNAYVNGDASADTLTGTATWIISGPSSTAGHLVAGNHEVGYSTGLASSLGYGFADNGASNNELTVTKKDLNVIGLTASNKVYDATTAAILGGTAAATALGADVVNIGGTATGTFADKNVGDTKGVTVSGNIISGADADNYNLIQQAGLTGDITPAALSVTASDASKSYGQTPTLAAFTSSGLQNGETIGSVTLTSAGTVATAGVTGSPYAITASDATGGSFSAGNYTITYHNGSLTITTQAAPVQLLPPQPQLTDGSTITVSVMPPAAAITLTSPPLTSGSGGTLSTDGTAQGETSTGGATTPGGNAGEGNSAIITPSTGIIIQLVSQASSSNAGIITVGVPKGLTHPGSSFSFPLPEQVSSAAGSGGDVKVSLANGNPLPVWLRYMHATRTFVAADVPAGSMPVTARVTVGGRAWTVEIAEFEK